MEAVTKVKVLTNFDPIDWYEVDSPPHGTTAITVKGMGEFYADPGLLAKQVQTDPEPVHPPFPPPVRDTMNMLAKTFKGLYLQTADEWELGFRQDQSPWLEIPTWEIAADAMAKYTAKNDRTPTGRANRHSVFKVLMNWMNHAATIPGAGVGVLSGRQVQKILAYASSPAMGDFRRGRTRYYRDLLWQGDTPETPTVITLDSLFDESGTGVNAAADFNPRELIDTRDVILGVDNDSRREVLIYGRDTLERIAKSGEGEAVRILRIEFDFSTDDLEKLCGIVQAVKGRHDYE